MEVNEELQIKVNELAVAIRRRVILQCIVLDYNRCNQEAPGENVLASRIDDYMGIKCPTQCFDKLFFEAAMRKMEKGCKIVPANYYELEWCAQNCDIRAEKFGWLPPKKKVFLQGKEFEELDTLYKSLGKAIPPKDLTPKALIQFAEEIA